MTSWGCTLNWSSPAGQASVSVSGFPSRNEAQEAAWRLAFDTGYYLTPLVAILALARG